MKTAVVVVGFILSVARGAPPAAGVGEVTHLAEMPAGCPRHYCTKPHPQYPHAMVDRLLHKYQLSIGHPHISKVYRQGDSATDDDCKNDASYELIHELLDADNRTVRMVVQSEHQFMQRVRVETCRSPGQLSAANVAPSSPLANSVHLEQRNIVCREESAPYVFLVVSLDGRRLEPLTRAVPVACVCRLCDGTRPYHYCA